MERMILFGILSVPVLIVSWRTLSSPASHGFYRFLSWECIIWLFASNYRFWFRDPFGAAQVVSWCFLIISGLLVITGALHLKKHGKQGPGRSDRELYRFEKTGELVDRGIYRYIRHPLYSSLLFLSWGIYMKHPTGMLLIFALLSTIFLFITAIFDEKECILYFGEKYREYMERTRRFIPFLL